MVKDTDKASDLLLEAMQLNDIPPDICLSSLMRLYVSICIANKIPYDIFCDGMDRLKKDYKRHCDAFKIR